MQEISPENLVSNTEYYLERFMKDEYDNSIIHLEPKYKMIAKFEKIETSIFNCKFPCFNNFRKLKYKNDLERGYRVTLNNYWKFYESSKCKIQKNMERRAYNKVLQQITNDEYFIPLDI